MMKDKHMIFLLHRLISHLEDVKVHCEDLMPEDAEKAYETQSDFTEATKKARESYAKEQNAKGTYLWQWPDNLKQKEYIQVEDGFLALKPLTEFIEQLQCDVNSFVSEFMDENS